MHDAWLAIWQWFESGAWTRHTLKVLGAAAIVAVGLTAAHLLSAALKRLRKRTKEAVGFIYIVEKLGSYGLAVFSVVAALSTLGVNLSSLAVLGGAVGVGAGLGLQGIVRQFVSGMVVIFDPQLNVGDFIELEGGLRGEITEVGPRATRVRTNDGVSAIIPNSHLTDNRVVNWTLQGRTRRIHVPFMVDHGADKARIRDAVLKAARAVPFTLPDTPECKTQVWLTAFSDSGLTFELVVWPTNEAVRRPASMTAAYNWAIETALREVEVAAPSQQLDVRLLSLFGYEGAEALKVLRDEPHPPAKAPAPRAASVPNDAAEDLVADAEREVREKAAEAAAKAAAGGANA